MAKICNVAVCFLLATSAAIATGRAQTPAPVLSTDDAPAIPVATAPEESADSSNDAASGELVLPNATDVADAETNVEVVAAPEAISLATSANDVAAPETTAPAAAPATAEVALGTESYDAYCRLVAGNARYLKKAATAANDVPEVATDPANPYPFATILYSADMTIKPDVLTQTTKRDVYMTPLAAGVVSSEELPAIEYGALNLQTPLLVVVGHYPSRDVSNVVRKFATIEKRAKAEAEKIAKSRKIKTQKTVSKDLKTYNLIGPAIARSQAAYPDLKGYDLANVVSEALVWQSLETILMKSTVVQDLVRAGKLDVVAAIADDRSGQIYWLGQHPLQEEFLKPASAETLQATTEFETSAATVDESANGIDPNSVEYVVDDAALYANELPEPLGDAAIQEYVERYENNVYYVNPVVRYYSTPTYYEPSWELFSVRAWTYRPWRGVWVESFVPWPYYYPWGPPPGVGPQLGLTFWNGSLNFYIGYNAVVSHRYVVPDFRPRDPWWNDEMYRGPGPRPRDPIYELLFNDRRPVGPPLPIDSRPGFRPGTPPPGLISPAVDAPWRPDGPGRPGSGYVPGAPGPGVPRPGYVPGALGPGVPRPGYVPGALGPERRPGRTPFFGPGGINPGSRPGREPGINPGREPGVNPGREPGVNPGREPGVNPGREPGVNPGREPGVNPGREPGVNPGREPGTRPGREPGVNPGREPGVNPGREPGVNPGREPGVNPGREPGTRPGREPGIGGGVGPGVNPGREPGTRPGREPGIGGGVNPGRGPGIGGGRTPGSRVPK